MRRQERPAHVRRGRRRRDRRRRHRRHIIPLWKTNQTSKKRTRQHRVRRSIQRPQAVRRGIRRARLRGVQVGPLEDDTGRHVARR